MEGIKRKNVKIITKVPAKGEDNVYLAIVSFPILQKYLKYNKCRKFAFLFWMDNVIKGLTVFILIT